MTSRSAAPTRRDVLQVASGAFAAVGTAATLWPLATQMNPDASTRAQAVIEVDLAPVKEGQAITVMWRGRPVFIRNRTPAEISAAEAVPQGELLDRYARNAALPDSALASDDNRTKPEHRNWLVLVGVCTHLGCVPQGQRPTDLRGDWGGWFCSCHGSMYDTAGRVRRGPAPANLEVPAYHFLSDTVVEIGRLTKDGPIA